MRPREWATPLTTFVVGAHAAEAPHEHDAVSIRIGDKRYGLNGTAQTYLNLPPLPRRLWRDSPTIPGAKVDIERLIRDGLRLC